MWWSKRAQPARVPYLPAFSLTGAMDSAIAAPVAQSLNATPHRARTIRNTRGPERDATIGENLRLEAAIEPSISLKCDQLIVAETLIHTPNVVGEISGGSELSDEAA